jgi:putative membrane-bound dehydrogenase-like protein
MKLTRPIAFFAAVLVLSAGRLAGQGFAPEDAVRRMRVPDGFTAQLVAAEPQIRQPLSITFDERGRLWVVQYLQYPNPAGLKPVKVDQYLRTVYDRVPAPPPHGPRGADRITILEDPDGAGRYRKAKDFVTGLNLVSGLAVGHGGAFVVQPPYLLFYPDRNGDDVPDGDPEILLTGFGMEDSHAVANSLQWGPDGWLYGAQGSTVTAKIRGIEFQQGIWRYHPRTREFELFSEGGGNTWGLDFDRHGNVIAGTNWGGFANLHQVQGGYYVKGFSKHGPLHNPYTFGYFDHVPYTGFKGGHVTCGGIVYQGGSYPKEFEGRYIAGNLLANAVYWHEMKRKGSSFMARFGGDFLVANDTWFRPIDCLVGPDGSVYVADWYDKRANHVDPVDNWDRSNGRIYKIEAKGTRPVAPFNLARLPSNELVELLKHPNEWFCREARRVLSERLDPAVIPVLRRLVSENKDRLALEALWALYVSGGFEEGFASGLFGHPNEDVRTWTVRLLGDARKVSPDIQARLVRMAQIEPSPVVRSQLACTCKRLPGKDGLPVVRELLKRQEDLDDPHIPLLLWWAVEAKADTDRDRVLALFDAPAFWRLPLVNRFIIERIGRRYLAEGGEPALAACSRLFDRAPGGTEIRLLVRGMEKALEGRRLTTVPPALARPLDELWGKYGSDLTVVRFALRLGSPAAYDRAVQLVADARTPDAGRVGLIAALGQAGKADGVPVLLKVFADARGEAVRQAALAALQTYQDPQIADTILNLYPKLPAGLRARAQALLCGRPATALKFLQAVDTGRIAAKDIPLEQLQQVLLHNREPLNRLVEKHWGKVGKQTTGEKQARIASVQHMLRLGKGVPANGKVLFLKNCATCHTLFGEGNKVGPDLTSADRKDTRLLVMNVVDPSAVVRPEFVAVTVETTDGRVLNGLVVEATPDALTLVDAKNQRTVIARSLIEKDGLRPSPVSLMPEKLLEPLDDQQICDLFSYLQGEAGGRETQAAGAPLKVCLVSGSLEYQSDESLAAFQKYLETNYPVKCTRAFRRTDDDLPGLENLETCDVMLLFTRRLTISGAQLERVKRYCRAGKPIVAVRTASHAFQNWLALDKEVLGGNYKNHYKVGPLTDIRIVERAKGHPVLAGFVPYRSESSLYRNTGLAKDVTVLLTGSIPDHTEPIAWTRLHNGGRVFYTSLGAPKDFADENFRRLLAHALFWTAKREPVRRKGP